MDVLEQLENAMRNAHAAGDSGAAQRLADAIWRQRRNIPDNYETVGAYQDGTIYRKPDGQLTFTSPGYSTSDQAAIQNMMQGVKPYTPNVGVAEGSMRAGLQGSTLGTGDEIVAASAAALDPLTRGSGGTFSDRYDAYLANERRRIERFQETNPKTALGAEVAGALASSGTALGGGLTAMKGAKTLSALMKGGAKDGFAYGTLAGLGYSEGDLYDRLLGATSGAITGTVAGAVFPPILAGGSALGRLVRDKVATKFGKPYNQAEARLAQAMRKAGLTPDAIAAKLDDLGPEGMLVDTLGEPGHALARTATNFSPVARETLETASSNRMAGQPDRLTDSLLEASGLDQPRTLQELQEAARTSARPAIEKANDAARSLGYDINLKAFDDLMRADTVAKAYAKGQRLARERMIAEASRAGKVGDDVLKNGPSNFDILHETKKSLDARGAPALGQPQSDEQAIAGQFSKTIRDRIDEYMPEYGVARGLERQLHKRQDAMALGAEGAKPRIAADFSRQVQAVDPIHRGDIAQSFAAAKIDQISNSPTTSEAVDVIFGPRRQQEALKAALGAKAAKVNRQVDAERVFGHTDRALKGNSTTAQMGAKTGGGVGVNIAIGDDPISAGLGTLALLLARKAGNATSRVLTTKREAKVAPMVANILAGRELPEAAMHQIEKDPALQKLLIRALVQQSGGAAGEAMTAR